MIAVIDYGIGNLRSAQKALEHVGADAELVARPDDLHEAEGVVLPGVGAFGVCAEALRSGGFEAPINEVIAAGVPFLGLCVGFQLLFSSSEESPGVAGLSVFPGVVRRLPGVVKLPQMQWNTVHSERDLAMVSGLPRDPWFYFVHSYAPLLGDVAKDDVGLVANYGAPFVAAIERGALWGTQFHPEKSGRIGLSLLGNFVARCADRDAR